MRLASAVLASSLASAATAAIATSPARADGFYVSDALGVGSIGDQLATHLDTTTVRDRVALGFRAGDWAFEPFVALEQTNPSQSFGAPLLTSYGLDVKRIMRVGEHVSFYVRGSISHIAFPDNAPCCVAYPLFLPPGGYGDLYGYSGRGLGAGVGAQLTGRIPVLGLHGALFLEDSYDYYRFLPSSQWQDAPRNQVDGSITRFSLGFAVGSDF